MNNIYETWAYNFFALHLSLFKKIMGIIYLKLFLIKTCGLYLKFYKE